MDHRAFKRATCLICTRPVFTVQVSLVLVFKTEEPARVGPWLQVVGTWQQQSVSLLCVSVGFRFLFLKLYLGWTLFLDVFRIKALFSGLEQTSNQTQAAL